MTILAIKNLTLSRSPLHDSLLCKLVFIIKLRKCRLLTWHQKIPKWTFIAKIKSTVCSVSTWCGLKYARMRFCSMNCNLMYCNACVCLYVCLYACQRTIFWIWLSPSILFRDRVSLYDHSPFCSMIDAHRLPEIFFFCLPFPHRSGWIIGVK